MKFRRLKLTGFKSFVEPCELLIRPGLTGIVGPNGCGKSNLLEALRWVMGENSFKNMRAAAMEDVIFNGSRERPARNMAEVVLTLDNEKRRAPEPWNDDDTLEVSRRIARGKGSTYRINGKEVRARDVQLLFADASTGARSPALVRQGRISELINAKPAARRRILEEAAGITGLHTRRHEAELKLKAAEHNLERLQDVTSQLESQRNSLSRQARQAERYRDISGRIRKLEAAGMWRAWDEARRTREEERAAHGETTRLLAEFTRMASQLSRRREEMNEKLAPLRQEEATRAAVLQRLQVELEGLKRREQAAERRAGELAARIEQAKLDMAREQDALDDARAMLERLKEERRQLSSQNDGEQARAEAARAVEEAEGALRQAQERVDELQARHSEQAARRAALERALEEAAARLARLEEEERRTSAELAALEGRSRADGALNAARRGLEEAEGEAKRAQEAATAAEEALNEARESEQAARQEWNDARREADKTGAEVATLEKLLGAGGDGRFSPLADLLRVDKGYEAALAAALGDELEAPLDEDAPIHWRGLPPLEENAPLPRGARPLSEVIEGPAELARRMAHVGLVDSAEEGARLQERLRPGQRLVTKSGDLWRWDGFTAAASAPTAAARRMSERNRLDELRAALEDARARAGEAEKAFRKAREERQAREQALGEARRRRGAAAAALEEARRELANMERGLEEVMRRLAALREAESRVRAARGEALAAREQAAKELAGLPADDGLRAELEKARGELEKRREAYAEARARHDGLQREAGMRAARLKSIEEESAQWRGRMERAEKRIEELEARREELRKERERLSAAPRELERQRVKLMNSMAEAEAQKAKAADALAEAEQAMSGLENDWREAERQAAGAREEAARLEARMEAAGERLAEITAKIIERMECQPEELPRKAGLDTDRLPAKEEIDRQLMKALDARERLGAVNLRAEEEKRQVEEELARLTGERDDVVKAIGKLRSAIASLNREGRRRLLEAFDRVNEYFAALFTTLFGGGRAHLELIEDDDPLQAGLEIFAQPPGKRLQTLSLLSGGEQTLTALALIFAVFLTNPSPICVLDEVDAPLDEHNVERFCTLLADMLKRTDTDFLIITHHPITMARMDRLFGVTMMEPGVSRLVSVDLQTAERMREAS